jgi:pimeloyl-ACP methyl ester carboxylesterase
MPRVTTPDGIELHWEERGSGPLVVLVSYWNSHPTVFDPIIGELEVDHRVIRYDDRGCGESSRVGPYDIETSTDDLEVVLEAAGGGPALAIGLVDGINRAARVAARRRDLVEQVIGVGSAPVTRHAFADSDSLIASNTVVGAFMQMLETDYRGAIRSMMETANPEMSVDDLRERVNLQVEYVDREASLARVRAWSEDFDGAEPARSIGDRLTIVLGGGGGGGGWFPDVDKVEVVYRETFPEALMVPITDGIVSAPELTAAVIRERTRLLTP